MKKSFSEIIKKYVLITLGCIIYAAGVSMFLDPNSLAPGGVSGIAIIISNLFKEVNVGLVIVLINIPILIAGLIKFGFRFLFSSIYAVLMSSLFMYIFEISVGPVTGNLLLAAIAGGVLEALGIGIIFRQGSTTGGTDIIVKLLHRAFRFIRSGTLFFIIDGIIIAVSGIVFKDLDVALYAALSLMVYTMVFNSVLYGADEARLVYIISPAREKIAERIMNELNAGATILDGKGAYTGRKHDVLMVVLRMRNLPQAKDIVTEEDNNAFMIVTKATSVFGEGFKSHDEGDL